MFEPVYEEISREFAGKSKFAKFNVLEGPENEALAARYGVMGTPTLMFLSGTACAGFCGCVVKGVCAAGD